MLPAWCIVFSIAIRLFAGGRYIWGLMKGRARPNPVTWFLWGLTAMVTFAAQLHEGVGVQALVTLALAIGPLIVCVLAVRRAGLRGHFTPLTRVCAVLALIGIVLWQVTDNPVLAVVFSIAADTLAGLPTVAKAYRDPTSEYALPYLLSIVSMGIVCLTITDWSFVSSAFVIYMLVSNVWLFAVSSVAFRHFLGGVRRLATA